MSGKTYTLTVSETELARVMLVMGKVNGHTDGLSVYNQACNIFGLEHNEAYILASDFNILYEVFSGRSVIDYNFIQEKWEKTLGVGKFKKSPVQQRIENLEKELDELKKLL